MAEEDPVDPVEETRDGKSQHLYERRKESHSKKLTLTSEPALISEPHLRPNVIPVAIGEVVPPSPNEDSREEGFETPVSSVTDDANDDVREEKFYDVTSRNTSEQDRPVIPTRQESLKSSSLFSSKDDLITAFPPYAPPSHPAIGHRRQRSCDGILSNPCSPSSPEPFWPCVDPDQVSLRRSQPPSSQFPLLSSTTKPLTFLTPESDTEQGQGQEEKEEFEKVKNTPKSNSSSSSADTANSGERSPSSLPSLGQIRSHSLPEDPLHSSVTTDLVPSVVSPFASSSNLLPSKDDTSISSAKLSLQGPSEELVPTTSSGYVLQPSSSSSSITPVLRKDSSNNLQKTGSSEKKSSRKSPWYNPFAGAFYKQKCDHYRRLFNVDPADRLLADYSCALQKDILIQGRMYIAEHHICFYANIFGWETKVVIHAKDIRNVTKERAAKFFPTAIQIVTYRPNEKYFFTSFTARDKAYLMVFRVWQNALLKQPMPAQELWHWVHASYGDDLGLTSDDDDYVCPNYNNTPLKVISSAGSRVSEGNSSVVFSVTSEDVAEEAVETDELFYTCSSVVETAAIYAMPTSSLDLGQDSPRTRRTGMPRPLSVIPTLSSSTTSLHPIQRSQSMENAPVSPGKTKDVDTESKSNKSEDGLGGVVNGNADAGGSSKKSSSSKFSGLVRRKKKVLHKLAPEGASPRVLRSRISRPASDLSESSESEGTDDIPVPHCADPHEGRELINAVFPVTVDTMFTLLFTSSKFLLDFLNEKKTYNIYLGPWEDGEQEGEKVRTTNFTVTLTQNLGPKTSNVTQNQRMRSVSKPGSFYSIDVDVINAGVPYANDFYVMMHFCITRTSSRECKLIILAQIKYRKQVWGLVKTFIDKNTWAGLEEYYDHLERELVRYGEEEAAEIVPSGRKRTKRGRGELEAGIATKIPGETGLAAAPSATAASSALGGRTRLSHHGPEPPKITESGILPSTTFLRVILGLLLLLLFCNAVLFTRLWNLEDQTTHFSTSGWIKTLRDAENAGHSLDNREDWVALIRQQERNHREEIQKWRDAVDVAANMLKQVELSLRSLHEQMDGVKETRATEEM